MTYVTVDEAKDQLLLFHDHDNARVKACIEAAEQYAADYMNRAEISDDQDWRPVANDPESEPVPQKVPASVKQAILFLVTDFYANRSATITGTIVAKHPAVEAMLHMYRKGLGV